MTTKMNSNPANNPPIQVKMEVADEYNVQEILNDGTEIYKQPLNMSENFAKIIQRIDFDKLSTMVANNNNTTTNDTTNNLKKDFEIPEIQVNVSSFINPNQRLPFSQLAPQFESIKSKIMNALTNISVMHDVIKVAKEPDYLVIERVAAKQDQNKQDEKPITILVAKKKAISQAAQFISTALERLQNEANHATKSRLDFHTELLTMRQNWRLRKKGQSIIGDLSFRGAWSNFSQPGAFEVIRNENQTPQNPSSLKVILPKTLEGGSFYVIRTVKGNLQSNTLFEPLKISHPQLQNIPPEPSWQTKLEIAQNMLFNNELFKRLAHESVLLKLPIPTIAAGNQILAPLFPGLQLSINLCHPSPNSTTPYDAVQNNAVLEHTLYQLLHEIHYKNMHFPLPHPTSATLAINSARHIAGPRAFDKKTLSQLSQNETILEQVIQQAQHSMLRLRTMCLIDSLAIEIQDPLIIPNWNYLNSSNQTSVRVDLYSYGYEGLTGCRTSVMLHIETKTVKAIMRDGRVLNLSFESQELRHLLLNLVSNHQVVAVQSLAKAMGWKVVSLNTSVGVGKQEPICGTASSIVLISPNGDRNVSVKSGPHSGIKVKLSSSPQEFLPSELITNTQWQQLNGPFKIVDWQRLPGKTFVNKMEYMMACLSVKSP